MKEPLRALALALPLSLPVMLVACDGHDNAHEQDGDHEHEHEGEEGHVHEPLIEGGALVELGDHEANLEVHLDAEKGELVIYLVDAHASDYVRSKQESLDVTVEPDEGEAYTLKLGQVASELSGEKVGDSSKYRVQDDRLKGVGHFHGRVASVSMLGATYTAIDVAWPAGEHDHDH